MKKKQKTCEPMCSQVFLVKSRCKRKSGQQNQTKKENLLTNSSPPRRAVSRNKRKRKIC